MDAERKNASHDAEREIKGGEYNWFFNTTHALFPALQ
jgi:hypothetical protein